MAKNIHREGWWLKLGGGYLRSDEQSDVSELDKWQRQEEYISRLFVISDKDSDK